MENNISEKIINIINRKKKIDKPKFTFLCIGTDKITGDALGPIVGSNIENFIISKKIDNVKVKGNLENPLCNKNINEYKNIDDSITILVDAAVSNSYEVGNIIVEENSTKIRYALKDMKKIPADISVKVVVSKNLEDEYLNFFMLQNIKLGTIIKLSEIVSKQLYKVIENYSI